MDKWKVLGTVIVFIISVVLMPFGAEEAEEAEETEEAEE